MNIGEIIQNTATGGAVILGVIYAFGGLIVNLNLTRRGIVEYQILQVKYLAVGLIFMFQFLGVALSTMVPVALLFLFSYNLLTIQLTSVVSILAALTLLRVWSRYPPNTTSFVGRWPFWFAMSVLALLYPLFVLLSQVFLPIASFESIPINILAVLTGALAILAQIYHYSSFYYGRPTRTGALDPVGMGIPTRVNILCDKSLSPSLNELGLSVQKNIIRGVYLIDETNDQYIISLEQVPGGDGNNQSYKINKSLVKIIMHTPDHMRRLSGGVREEDSDE